MAFEDKEAELGLLLTRMLSEPHDRHEIYELTRQKLNELKANGMPLPEDLVQFEEDLEPQAGRWASTGSSGRRRLAGLRSRRPASIPSPCCSGPRSSTVWSPFPSW